MKYLLSIIYILFLTSINCQCEIEIDSILVEYFHKKGHDINYDRYIFIENDENIFKYNYQKDKVIKIFKFEDINKYKFLFEIDTNEIIYIKLIHFENKNSLIKLNIESIILKKYNEEYNPEISFLEGYYLMEAKCNNVNKLLSLILKVGISDSIIYKHN